MSNVCYHTVSVLVEERKGRLVLFNLLGGHSVNLKCLMLGSNLVGLSKEGIKRPSSRSVHFVREIARLVE
jgi:hypothetical protein